MLFGPTRYSEEGFRYGRPRETWRGLSATAVLTALLAGSFLRAPAPVVDQKAPQAPLAAPSAPEAEPSPSALKQMRPAMELLGQTLGIEVDPAGKVSAASAVLTDLESEDATRWPEPVPLDIRKGIKKWTTLAVQGSGSDTPPDLCAEMLKAVAGFGRRTAKDGADLYRSHTARSGCSIPSPSVPTVARSTTSSRRPEGRMFGSPSRRIPLRRSSSGWRADEVIDALQAAMSANSFVLDRFRLIDWVPADQRNSKDVASSSKAHEKQPGVLIFRHVEGKRLLLRVLFLVLKRRPPVCIDKPCATPSHSKRPGTSRMAVERS